jgi:NAD(P)-dependent dehydrogenase (short-subunit alcohol dehydrogenase family)
MCVNYNFTDDMISSGAVDTPFARSTPLPEDESAGTYIPLGRAGEANEIAPLFAFLLSQDASYATGGVYLVDGGLMA